MKLVLILVVVVAGAGIPVQVAANKRLEKAVDSAPLAVALAFVVGAVAMIVLKYTGWLGRGQLSGAVAAPWWAWSGGLLSAAVVIASVIALPQAGTAAVVAATVFGQLLAAAVIDHFGWLDVPQIRMNGWRICGAILLLAGALMMQKK
jgi:transporter family-2 protein